MTSWRRSPFPTYDPATDASLSQWLDAGDSTMASLEGSGGAAITNNATVFKFKSKKGTSRTYQLIGPNTRPTWQSSVQNGLGGLRCDSQILSANVLTGMQSLSGRTVVAAFKQNSLTLGAAEGFTVTEAHEGGSADGPQLLLYGSAGAVSAGGKRIQADSFATCGPSLADTGSGARVVANGEAYIVACIWDYANARFTLLDNGRLGTAGTFQSAGTTSGTAPYAMSVGGILQENGTLGANTGNGFLDGWLLEVLDTFVAKTIYDTFLQCDYLCRRWKIR
jgi:hypothetical protein